MAWSSANGTSLPMTAAACSRRLSSGGEAVDAGGEDRLDRGRHLDASRAAAPGDRPPRSPTSARVSTSVRTLSSRKNGLPSVRSISRRLSGPRLGSSPSSACEQFVGALGGQRVEPELAVVGLAAPAVLVFGPVVDQEQQARRRQALDQAVEQRLRLGSRSSAGPRRPASSGCTWLSRSSRRLTRVERALAALRRVERCPGGIVDRHVQQREQAPAASARARGRA